MEGASYHAKNRAAQRFGIKLTQSQIDEILGKIKRHELLVESENKEENSTIYKTVILGKVFRIVYSHRSRQIITVMKSAALTFRP